MEHPVRNLQKKALGELSEMIITVRLIQAGYTVYKSYGDSLRCDLIMEDVEGKLWKVQCKTAWLDKQANNEALRFAAASNHYHYRGGRYNHARRDYHGQVDYFAVYSPNLDKVYLIPIDQAGKTDMKLRIITPKGRNHYGIKMAEDYEL
jgi:PD-(D/E)XK endonuclease